MAYDFMDHAFTAFDGANGSALQTVIMGRFRRLDDVHGTTNLR